MEKYYKVGQVAKMLGVHKMTLHRWEKAGLIPVSARMTINNYRMYSENDIEAIKKIIYFKK